MALPLKHVYVHIPFCHRICPYCSFFKHQPGGTDIGAFLNALLAEAASVAQNYPLEIETIYFGGGTPSLISTSQFETFLPAFLQNLGHPTPVEWTLEANPMTFDREKASLWKSHGINRVSLGVQAWDEPTLQTLGRDHSPTQAENSLKILQSTQFETVSVDLMFSIPGQPLASWEDNLRKTIDLGTDHVSAYNLNYEEDTQFFERLKKGIYRQDDDSDVPFFEAATASLSDAGFRHYEISNYAKAGKESYHNAAYWRGADFIGLGPSAFSTIGRQRWQNICHTASYIRKIEAGEPIALPAEILDDDAWRCERIALELRTAKGVSLEVIGDSRADVVDVLVESGHVVQSAHRIRLTNSGKLLADSVACELL